MDNEVYGTAMLDVSIPTDKNVESIALNEAGYKTDPINVKKIELKITNHDGEVTYFDIHSFKFIMNEFFND